jgi:hypothetical protein
MDHPSSDPPRPRVTLKLKGPPRKASPPPKAPAPASAVPAANNPNTKPGAHWSDEYKRRMQADMDELTRK